MLGAVCAYDGLDARALALGSAGLALGLAGFCHICLVLSCLFRFKSWRHQFSEAVGTDTWAAARDILFSRQMDNKCCPKHRRKAITASK